MQCFQERSAFTLIEMLVVVAILGILASVAVPTFGEFLREYKLNRFSRSLLMALKGARFKAISRQRNIRGKFDLGSGVTTSDDIVSWEICASPPKSEDGTCPGKNYVKFSEMTKMKPPSPVIIYQVNGSQSGIHYAGFKPQGTGTLAGDDWTDNSPHIQTSTAPAPAESEKCKFNTIRLDNTTGILLYWGCLRKSGEDVSGISCCH